MSERNYDKEPIVLRATIEVYVYENVDNLEEKIKQFNTDNDVEEAALYLVGGYFADSLGLNECKIKEIK